MNGVILLLVVIGVNVIGLRIFLKSQSGGLSQMDGRIFALLRDMHDSLALDWDVKKMAALSELSVSYFPAIFKAETGMSPGVYLKKIRLEKAKHLLETTHEHIKQIGIKVGLPNESHFTRDFKEKYNLTPTDYRRKFNERLQSDPQWTEIIVSANQ